MFFFLVWEQVPYREKNSKKKRSKMDLPSDLDGKKRERHTEEHQTTTTQQPPVVKLRHYYFVEKDIVWVRPPKLPYWPAEVVHVQDGGNVVQCSLFSPPSSHPILSSDTTTSPTTTSMVVTCNSSKVFFFNKLRSDEEVLNCVEERLQRTRHKVEAYEEKFNIAVREANRLVRIVLDAVKSEPIEVRPIGTVYSLMRTHTDAPRQPQTKNFEAQSGVIQLRSGLENAVRDLKGFEWIWVVFYFNYATGIHPERKGGDGCDGWKTMVVPPRDTQLRGVLATRSPHRPNFIGLSCVRLLDVRGLEVFIADHDLLHGTPVLDIKPYLPFCDAHPNAKAGWVDDLDAGNLGGPDHRGTGSGYCVHRSFDGQKKLTRHS